MADRRINVFLNLKIRKFLGTGQNLLGTYTYTRPGFYFGKISLKTILRIEKKSKKTLSTLFYFFPSLS